MSQLSESSKNLVEKYGIWQQSIKPAENVSTIHVDEVAMRVAAFYEHLRTIVDWKEEHLMRRAAILRKLKMRFDDLDQQTPLQNTIAEGLVLDLIRGGYFPNDAIEESKIPKIQEIINKYIFIIINNPEGQKSDASKKSYDLLLEIASCEVEETLAPSIKEMALIDYMFSAMKERVAVSEKVYQKHLLEEKDKDIQIYIAVQQALFKLDEPIISYNLLRYKYPQWNIISQEELLAISHNINGILQKIGWELNHPMAKKFYAICEKYDTAYLIIGDILSREDFEKVAGEIHEPGVLEGYVRKAYEKRLNDLNAKVARAAMYSTISIFVTKILSLLVLEWAIAAATKTELNYLFLAVDVAVPTALMILMVMIIKPPSKKNITTVIAEVMKVFYVKEKVDTYTVKVPRQRGFATKAFLGVMYLIGASITVGTIYTIFHYFQFPIYSIIINIIFIALILFAGTLIQKRAQELVIEQESGGFIIFFADILFLPLTGIGHWISNKWKKYNAVTAFMNALIDLPFGIFVEFLERWRGFINERKEDMR